MEVGAGFPVHHGAGSCAIDYEPQEALDVMIPIMTLLKFLYQ